MNIQTCPDQLRRKERGTAAEVTMFQRVSQNPRLPQRTLRWSLHHGRILAYAKTPRKRENDFKKPPRHSRSAAPACQAQDGRFMALLRATALLPFLRRILRFSTSSHPKHWEPATWPPGSHNDGLSPASRRQPSGHTSDGLGGLLRPHTPARRHHQAVCHLGLNRHATPRPVRSGNLH